MTSIERKNSKNGDYAKVSINGKLISFFPPSAEAAFKIREGSTVSAEYVDKGQYSNGRSISLLSGASLDTGAGPNASNNQQFASPAKPSNLPTGGNEAMMVSYAKDLLVANPALTAKEAVDMVFDLIEEVKSAANPTTPSTT